MSMDICITLSDADLTHFVDSMKAAQKEVDISDAASVIAAAKASLAGTKLDELPDFIATRLKSVETMLAMVEDVGFDLPEANRANVLAALSYFATADDSIPDDVPVIGFLDDAIMIELCVRDLTHEISAYNEFRLWRGDEARRRGIDVSTLVVTHVEWAEARRLEVLERMHRQRRESYSSGAWRPVLFRVH
ncbi:MAG: YkvA family protein [Rhodanobacter sp.]